MESRLNNAPSLWLLIGVPLAFIGMFLSLPGFMRSIGIWLNRVLNHPRDHSVGSERRGLVAYRA
jgi:hypothetical protein